MQELFLKKLRENPGLAEQAAKWFHEKWEIPLEEYIKSISEAIECPAGIPQWYVVTGKGGEIVAGAGVIENDFHSRKDLAPNLCALFVEEGMRGLGLARMLLDAIRKDVAGMGVSVLYLVTDHTEFYEKCGWEFLTMVEGEDGVPIRMYRAATI